VITKSHLHLSLTPINMVLYLTIMYEDFIKELYEVFSKAEKPGLNDGSY
jgi:hypothetical protein